MTAKDQAIAVTNEMIAAAEGVEDLYRRGTPDTWRKVYLAMRRAAPHPEPDCRTCDNAWTEIEDGSDKYVCLGSNCTNGDKYQPAPAVVLWRTE